MRFHSRTLKLPPTERSSFGAAGSYNPHKVLMKGVRMKALHRVYVAALLALCFTVGCSSNSGTPTTSATPDPNAANSAANGSAGSGTPAAGSNGSANATPEAPVRQP